MARSRLSTTTTSDLDARAQAEGGRLAEEMHVLGVDALFRVITDDSLDHKKVVQNLVFLRNVKFNKNFDLISERGIRKHYQENGL